MKKTGIVGSKINIDLPEVGVFGVAAKVDTGADSSSIWASDVHESDGELCYTLFGPKFEGYNGKVIKTTKFTQSRVMNSFGEKEVRYKVSMVVDIEGVAIRTKFTLADRQRNRFPVLIGRQTLSGRFLVDVSKSSYEPDGPRKVLIASSKVTSGLSGFAEKVQGYSDNVQIDCVDYSDFVIKFIDGEMSVVLRSTGEDLAAYDIVHFKTSETRDITASLARYCVSHGVKIFDPAILNFPTTSKLYEYTLLSDGGIKIPDSIFVTPSVLVESFDSIKEELGLPFVAKGVHESKGNYNYLINSHKDLKRATSDSLRDGIYLIAQKFIPNKGDYRVLVMGQKIELVIERNKTSDDTHLNNTSAGADAKLHAVSHLPEQVRHDSLRAARIMERDIAGVDMMQGSDDGVWYCLEVNDGPQIATGAFTEEKQRAFAQFINRRLG